jgi:hypothetical protein
VTHGWSAFGGADHGGQDDLGLEEGAWTAAASVFGALWVGLRRASHAGLARDCRGCHSFRLRSFDADVGRRRGLRRTDLDMAKFFVPNADTPDVAEEAYDSMRKHNYYGDDKPGRLYRIIF